MNGNVFISSKECRHYLELSTIHILSNLRPKRFSKLGLDRNIPNRGWEFTTFTVYWLMRKLIFKLQVRLKWLFAKPINWYYLTFSGTSRPRRTNWPTGKNWTACKYHKLSRELKGTVLRVLKYGTHFDWASLHKNQWIQKSQSEQRKVSQEANDNSKLKQANSLKRGKTRVTKSSKTKAIPDYFRDWKFLCVVRYWFCEMGEPYNSKNEDSSNKNNDR